MMTVVGLLGASSLNLKVYKPATKFLDCHVVMISRHFSQSLLILSGYLFHFYFPSKSN